MPTGVIDKQLLRDDDLQKRAPQKLKLFVIGLQVDAGRANAIDDQVQLAEVYKWTQSCAQLFCD